MINTIYILKNKINSKIYIGQTWESLYNRFDNGNGYIGCTHLWQAIKKYGKENFYYEVLVFCGTQEVADYWESYFINKYDSCNRTNGYNLRSGGARGLHSEETKNRMSLAQKGRVVSDATKKKLSETTKNNPIIMLGSDNPMYGKTGSLHPMYGKNHTDEAKQKISKSKRGKPSPNKGKTMSDEARRKMSEAKKGYIPWNKGKGKKSLTT